MTVGEIIECSHTKARKDFMASIQKYTNDAVRNMILHNTREIIGNSNTDIDSSKTPLNYSFAMPTHGGKSDYKYYKELIDSRYIYGRGTSRESGTITACSWVVTCPKEIVDNPDKVNTFFEGTYNFISRRYGEENIISNSVHFDEAGEPHIHVLFAPSTAIDHDKIHYKTIKDKKPTITDTGRYEIGSHYKLENGERVPIKNYAKMSDYYDYKLSANDVINKYELQHFHQDLQNYLDANGIEGRVLNGATTGGNYTVKELKEFTQKTGLTLEDVKTQLTEHTLLESYVERTSKVQELEEIMHSKDIQIEALQKEVLAKDINLNNSEDVIKKDEQIKDLIHTINEKNLEISEVTEKNQNLENKLIEVQQELESKQKELVQVKARVDELEKEKSLEKTQEWGHSSAGWGDKTQSEWGARNLNIEEEHTW